MTARILILLAALGALPIQTTAHEKVPAVPSAARTPAVTSTARALESTNSPRPLPPLPADVAELKFSDFFKPIGARGLEFSDRLRALAGRRVRILGYMVRQSQPVSHQFLLTPVPLALHESEYGFAEDMPATVLHVTVQTNLPATVSYTPGLLLLTGTLSIGNRPEPDGRISTVRLALDLPNADQQRLMTAPTRSHETISTNAALRSGTP
jgi:hypothetical protein